MTAVQMNAAILRELSRMQGDEILLGRALKSLRRERRVRKSEFEANGESANLRPASMLAEIIREGEREIAEGNFTPIAIEDLWK